jgi:hypothetical protein
VRSFFLIFFLLITSTDLASRACLCGNHYSSLNTAAGPIITIPAHTLDQGRVVLGYGMNYMNYSAFSQSRLRSLNQSFIHAHSINSSLLMSANLSLGLTDNLNISLIMPYYMGFGMKTTDRGNTIDDGNSIGFSDLSLLLKYRFLHSKKNKFALAALAGIKMPTGNTSQKNEFGFLLGADDQPGSGSWDPLMGLALSKSISKINIDSNALYILSTPGSQNITVGDQVLFNLGFSHLVERFSGKRYKWTVATEINGHWQEKVEYLGVKDPNHGGLVIYISPGIKLNYRDRVFTNLYVSLPTIQNLNGEQSDIKLQLGFNMNLLI